MVPPPRKRSSGAFDAALAHAMNRSQLVVYLPSILPRHVHILLRSSADRFSLSYRLSRVMLMRAKPNSMISGRFYKTLFEKSMKRMLPNYPSSNSIEHHTRLYWERRGRYSMTVSKFSRNNGLVYKSCQSSGSWLLQIWSMLLLVEFLERLQMNEELPANNFWMD